MQRPDELERFVRAQDHDGMYALALSEIRAGRKQSHWIWYIFPQLRGLGHSMNSGFFGIAGLEEARRYLAHPVLGARLEEITCALLSLETSDPLSVMGYPDNRKLHSCMTLFARAGAPGSIYERALARFFGGAEDVNTLRLLGIDTPL